MLKSLIIKNFALIEEISLDFQRGLNILTGETGAGKSVIVDAIMVLLGDRASSDYIRRGEKKAIIEGIFELNKKHTVLDLLNEGGFYDGEGELIIRREILDKGISRCFLNDSPITLSTLKKIGDYLVDFHGQHEHQLLMKAETHIELLDNVSEVDDLKTNYLNKYNELKDLCSHYQKTLDKEKSIKEKRELYFFEIESIKNINPKENELNILENELRILQNVELLHNLSYELTSTLDNSENKIRESILNAQKILEQLNRIDDSFQEYYKEFKSVLITIDEVTKYAKSYSDKIEYDEKRIDEIRQRLLKLNSLRKKYGSYNSIFERLVYLENELSLIDNFDNEISNLANRINILKEDLSCIALEISSKRKNASKKFSLSLKEFLSNLGMPNVEFFVYFTMESISEPEITDINIISDGKYYKAYSNGCDRIEFFISTNKGELPKPLSLVASGGEISRIMLAIKSILSDIDDMPILIFDEIDTGISGRIAQKVGLAMKQLAIKHQIIAITHLPQIAAKGDRNFNVRKIESSDHTTISCKMLNSDEKIKEIAILISGENVTKSAIESAKELLK